MKDFDEFLEWERKSRETIDFKMIYVDVANDLIAGLLLSQIIYWFLPDKNGQSKLTKKDGKEFLVKKRSDWYDEIRITEKQYDRAISILEKKRIVKTYIQKSNFYDGGTVPHIELRKKNLLIYLNAQSGKRELTKGKNENRQKVKTRIDERSKPIVTESTSETTTEIKEKQTKEISNLPEKTNGNHIGHLANFSASTFEPKKLLSKITQIYEEETKPNGIFKTTQEEYKPNDSLAAEIAILREHGNQTERGEFSIDNLTAAFYITCLVKLEKIRRLYKEKFMAEASTRPVFPSEWNAYEKGKWYTEQPLTLNSIFVGKMNLSKLNNAFDLMIIACEGLESLKEVKRLLAEKEKQLRIKYK